MVREELHLSATELPERQLKAVWLALDEDGSGRIATGEFGKETTVVQLLAPLGEDSTIGKYISKNKNMIQQVCYRTYNLDKTIEVLRQQLDRSDKMRGLADELRTRQARH